MDDEEVERFEISDWDIQNEFRTNRVRNNLTKKQQIYGVFGGSDSDSEDDGWSSKKKGRKSASSGVSFVSGGVQQAGKKKEKEEASPVLAVSDSSDSEDDNSQVEDMTNLAGLRVASTTHSVGDIGKWEKHTRGIGAKLLLKMGYEPGKGLGKNLQGITQPIAAKLRKGRGAVGAHGHEANAPVLKKRDEEEKKEIEADPERPWRKGVRTKYNIKTIQDVMESGRIHVAPKGDNPLTHVKVIDMRGPQQRVFSGYHLALGGRQMTVDKEDRLGRGQRKFAVPELTHNLKLLVNMCEQDIIDNERRRASSEDRLIVIGQEKIRLEPLLEREDAQIKSINIILKEVETLYTNPSLTTDDVVSSLTEMKVSYDEEWILLGLADLALAMGTPLIQTHLDQWKPLEDPIGPQKAFEPWKAIFTDNSGFFDRFIWETWFPHVQRSLTVWPWRQPLPALNIVSEWGKSNLLSVWLLEQLCNGPILSRLQKGVEEWNPLTDTVPIHAWVQPWSTHMRLDILFPPIRQKLGVALTAWHASDSSAFRMLLPWKDVFTPGAMAAFLLRHIIPKLQNVLQSMAIVPSQQNLDPWKWVILWQDLIAATAMVNLLHKHFFPRWLSTLATWLQMSPNFQEVGAWYTGWKEMVPQVLHSHPNVKEHFRRALEMMNHAVASPGQPLPAYEQQKEPVPFQAAAPSFSSLAPQGFRELVQRRCEQHGIVFVPIPQRWQDGRQVYRCGRQQVFLDQGVIYLNRDGQWIPLSLQSLIDCA